MDLLVKFLILLLSEYIQTTNLYIEQIGQNGFISRFYHFKGLHKTRPVM